MREFPGTGRKTFGLYNVITKLLKQGTSKRKRGVPILWTALEPNEQHKWLLGLKLVCW